MTASNPNTLSYSVPRPAEGLCPLCRKRPVKKKTIYGHPVCKKCFYAFANRRQGAYMIDGLLATLVNVAISISVTNWLRQQRYPFWQAEIIITVAAIPVLCLFMLKDGFNGRSPGKYVSNIQAVDAASGQPISFGQSFKRYWFMLFAIIPFYGGLIASIFVIIAGFQLAKGYRTAIDSHERESSG